MTSRVCVDCGRITDQPNRGRCPECARTYSKKRNAAPTRAAHHTTRHQRIRARLFATQPNRCVYCGRTDDLTVHYVIPLVAGGPMTIENAVIACRSCNSSRGGGLSRGGRGYIPHDPGAVFPKPALHDPRVARSRSVRIPGVA